MPFTRDAFFDVFAAYNTTLWPAVVGLWVVSAWVCVRLWSHRLPADRWISGLLATQWAWAAVAYHVAFFSRINPLAWLFAALFLVQAGLLFWFGVIRSKLFFSAHGTTSSVIGGMLAAYSLVYPVINAVQHDSIVRIPTFGLPCPTTVFTAGLLMLATPRVWTLAIVPVIWSAVGGSAAVVLGVSADYALPVAGVALVVCLLRRSGTAVRTQAVGAHTAG